MANDPRPYRFHSLRVDLDGAAALTIVPPAGRRLIDVPLTDAELAKLVEEGATALRRRVTRG